MCPDGDEPVDNWADEEIDLYLRLYGVGVRDEDRSRRSVP